MRGLAFLEGLPSPGAGPGLAEAAPVALVTGGSRGIGRAIVRMLSMAGARVAFTYLEDEAGAAAAAREAGESGGMALSIRADARDFARAQEVVREVSDAFGHPAILVNNAGITRDGVIWKMEEEAWTSVIDLNLNGCFNYIRAVAPGMREQRLGRIVNIASINGLRGKFGQSNYAASKAGIIGLTKSAARELGPYGVTVNAVAPGLVLTDMADRLPPELVERAREETALGHPATPEDVAAMVIFLCSGAARHVTGEVIKVDGGQYI